MKKLFVHISIGLMTIMALSCTEELRIVETNGNEEEIITLTPAEMMTSDLTKITLDNVSLNWEMEGDTVAVYQYGYYYDSSVSNTKITRKSNANLFIPSDLSSGHKMFTGTMTNYVKEGGKLVTSDTTYNGQSNELYCIYPYDRGASWSSSGSYYTKTIPSSQSGLISDFNKNLFLLAQIQNDDQKVDDKGVLSFSAQFRHMLPVIKFNVPASLHAVSITLSATDSTSAVVPLSGRFKVKCNRYDKASGWTAVNLQDTVTVYRNGAEISGDVYICIYPDYVTDADNIKSAAKRITFTVRNADGGVATVSGKTSKLAQAGNIKDLGTLPTTLKFRNVGKLAFLEHDPPCLSVAGCMAGSRFYYSISYGETCADPTESSPEFTAASGFEIPCSDYEQILVKVLVKKDGEDDLILKGLLRNWYFALKSSIGLTVAPDTTISGSVIIPKEYCCFAKNEERTSNGMKFKNEGSAALNVEYLNDAYISWKSKLNFYVTPMNEGAKATLFMLVGSNSSSKRSSISVYNGSNKVGTAKSDVVGNTSSIPNILDLGTVSKFNNLKFAPGGGTILSKFIILEQGDSLVSVNPSELSIRISDFSTIGLPTTKATGIKDDFPFVYQGNSYNFYVNNTGAENTPVFYYSTSASYVAFSYAVSKLSTAAFMEFPAIPGYRLKSVNFVNNSAYNRTISIYGDQVDYSHNICSKKIPDKTPQGDFIIDVPAGKDPGTYSKYIYKIPYSSNLYIRGLIFTYKKFDESSSFSVDSLVLNCNDATEFRYDNGGVASAFPTTTHGMDFVTGEFWLSGYESFKFYGSVKSWNSTLNAAKSSPVTLPKIDGFSLAKVEISYSHSSSNRQYSVTDGTNVLGTITAVKEDGGVINLDGVYASSDDRYLVCDGEMCCKFSLIYVSEK